MSTLTLPVSTQQIEHWIQAASQHIEASEPDTIFGAVDGAFRTPAGTVLLECIANGCMESIHRQDVHGFLSDIMTIFEIGFRCALDVQAALAGDFRAVYAANNHR